MRQLAHAKVSSSTPPKTIKVADINTRTANEDPCCQASAELLF